MGLKPGNPLAIALAQDQQQTDQDSKPGDDLSDQQRQEMDALAARIFQGG